MLWGGGGVARLSSFLYLWGYLLRADYSLWFGVLVPAIMQMTGVLLLIARHSCRRHWQLPWYYPLITLKAPRYHPKTESMLLSWRSENLMEAWTLSFCSSLDEAQCITCTTACAGVPTINVMDSGQLHAFLRLWYPRYFLADSMLEYLMILSVYTLETIVSILIILITSS